MSEEKIDSLDIQIETSLGSDTAKQISKASSAIKRMAENLKDVDTSRLEKLNSLFKGTKELESYAQSIKTVSSSIKSLSKIDQSGLQKVKSVLGEISGMKFDFSQLEGLKNIDFTGLSKFGKSLNAAKANAKQMADALKPIEERMTIGQQMPPAKFLASNATLAELKRQKDALGFTPTVNRPLKSLVGDTSSGNMQQFDSTAIQKYVDDFSEKINVGKKKSKELKDAINSISSVNPTVKTSGLEKMFTVSSKLSKLLKTLGSGLKFVGGKALSLGKSLFASKTGANGLSGSLHGGYKAFLRYGLGIRSTFALLNKLRSSFGNAMNNLVQYSNTTNRAVSSMWNSLNALKNSLATAFAPVINSVAPYVSALIDMLTDAMNTIAQFFAAITGSKTVVVAKKQNKNYAASLGNIGSAAGGSADKVKDLADALDLLDFDEINKLSDNTSNKGSGGSGGGSGSGGSGVAGMFETETVDSAFKDLADLFKNGDWDAIGDIIADGINSAVGKLDAAISWDNVGDKITNICNGITSIFNRVVDKMDWSMLGKTVGDGVNTVVNTINLLYDGVSWGNLGSKMATGVNSIFTTVDWDAVGAFLVQKFNAVWEFGAGFFGNLDGKSIGEDIGTALNSAMKHLNLNAAKSSLTGKLNTLSDIIGGFNKTVDWKSMTTKLSDAVKGMITGVKWDELGANLGELMGNLVKTLVTIVTDPDTLGALIKGGSDLILGFFDGILTAIGGDKWTAVKEAVKGVNDWLNESGNKNVGNMVLSGITFDFEMNQETRNNFAGFIGKINSESVELKVDTKLLQSGDDAWRDYAKKWNEQKPELKIPDSVINGGKSEIIKWLSDAYAQDPTLSVGVETEKTGAETVGEFDKSADRVGGAHIDVNPRKPAKETAQDFANEVNASGAKASIDVEGKLKNNLDMSGLGNVQVDASAKLNTYSNGLIDNKKPSIGTIARLNDHSNGLTGNNKPSIGTIARLNDSSNGLTGKSKPSVNVYGNIDKAGGQPDSKPKVNAKADFDHKDNYVKPSKTYYPKIPAIAAVQNAAKASKSKKKTTKRRALGGVFSNGMWKNLPQFAGGGIITSQKIGRFAGGGLPMHGTMFAAGEKGAEVVGNINGRTEVLNQSQIASAIYAAMIQAMKQQNVSVDVSLQGDANTMFKVVQKKARQYTVQTGKMPFAY